MIARTAATPDILVILANTLSLSITVTNWMFGLIATFLRLPIRRAIQVALNGFALLSLFWIVGHIYVPGAVYIGPTLFEKTFVYVPTLKRVAGVLLSFAGYSMVAPTANDFTTYNGPRGLSVQGVWPSLDLTGCILLAWFVLLGYGCWASYRLGERFVFRLLTAWLAGQLILHTVYGEETFLYSLHWTPFLIMTAAAGCRGRTRVPAVVFAALLAIMSGFSNYTHLHAAIEHLVTIGSLK
jgi:hypothetical protein